ncbi:putative math and uch domain containing protein [Diplodia seriata]|uniref:Putative math and uch domain containing protein n=1 Tax=Diplodia seriata TaxID=420778 RepID=A0A0G2E8B3_9PEZI|nr:putative math and uch domain containing protein [Diplodia seriata]
MLKRSIIDEYWQRRTFQDLDDPEFTPGPTGRVDWTIPNYNGTRENPNRELLMKSPIVNVGGYDWQIKFYPRGNDSDFLSVWDSFAMTGLQGLADSEYESHAGSLIAAISSWMLLKPFRQFLYELELTDPTKEARAKPKPLLSALQRTIYKLRTEVLPGSGPVDLDDVADALEWYGTDSCLSKLDVIEIWEILRAKIEYELADTPSKDKLKDLFGPERDRMMNIPTYRAPVTDCPDMQAAIDKSVNLVQSGAPLPKVLHVELERQEFNRENRSMRKRADKVKLLEKVTINKTAYILYGFIVHRDSLQSGSYYSVVRPKGPGGKWYAYYDGKEENRVVCLTRRQAIEAHEGGGTEKSAVAYIVMYVRQDVVPKQFSKNEPKWEVPQWLKNRSICGRKQSVFETTEETLDYQVFDSAAFSQHEGPGIMDPYDPKWETSPYRTNIRLPASASAREVRKLLAQQFHAKDPRQVKFCTPPLQPMENVVVIPNPNIPPFDFAVPPPITHNLTASHEEIYYFLKMFEPESQTLRAQKTVVAKKSDRIDHSVLDALDWPRDIPFDVYEEEAPMVATKLQRGGVSFNQAGIHSTAILIAQVRLSPEQRAELASRALFSDPGDYVQHATAARFVTSTTPLTGHFTMDYFSSEHYMGVLVRGRPHGTGRHLYFDGSEYIGSYRLGQRHGNGRLTYPNGDVYEGEWADNLPEGRGSFIEAETGNSYLGGWKAGKKFGEGVTHWKNAQEIERLCRICWEESADAAFYDCGHVVACLNCARRVDNCPVCRRRVLSAMKLYFGN